MKNISILFVDDEAEIRTIMSHGLEERGFKVFAAESATEALKILETTKPDLIISDIKMEPMNGFDFFQKVRRKIEFIKTPFFFITAIDDLFAEKFSSSLGANAYLTKPVDIDKLESLIRDKIKL